MDAVGHSATGADPRDPWPLIGHTSTSERASAWCASHAVWFARWAAPHSCPLVSSPARSWRRRANAIIGGCRGDPIIVLSNGTALDLSATADTDPSKVGQIAYTLHAPSGVWVVSVTSLGPKETLSFLADNTPYTYDTVTRVVASTSGAAVTTTTIVIPLLGVPMTGSAAGATNENLRVSLTP